ncbi:MAG: 50S ribosomal protein L13 [Candidatus Parcubacteria bacterium]|nr:50S ribosomal protein L13 [Candidatus Parcubacteria bacterium]
MKRETHTIDATDKVLGRMATEIVCLLRGKNRPDYAPNVDSGAFVIIKNMEKVKFTGKKFKNKTFFRHSGYIGSDKEILLKDLFQKKPGEVLRKAVLRMLPKNKLRARQIIRLKFE